MSAIGLLVLVSLFGQVGAPTLPATPSASQGELRDFGWRIADDGALEYIVQLSPQVAEILQKSNNQFASHMPPELVGRATRVVVQVGTGDLPRVPSLEELDREPRYSSATDLQAALGRGQFSDVEADSLKNVQGGNVPPLPAFPNSGSLTDAVDNVVDRAANAAANLPNANSSAQQLGDRFLGGARNTPNAGAGNLGTSGLAPSASLPSTAGQGSKFNSTAPLSQDDPTGRVGNVTTTGTDNTGLDPRLGANPWPTDNSRFADNPQLPNYSEQPATNDWNSVTDPRSLGGQSPQYVPPSRDGGIAQRGQMPGRSLSDQLGQDRFGSTANDPRAGYSSDGYPVSNDNRGFNGGGMGYAERQGQDAFGRGDYSNVLNRTPDPLKVASLTTNKQTASDTADKEKSASDETSNSGATKSKNNQNLLVVFFLLSLVVNVYLGMLIRKLLTRYRSLLSSVRSQIA